MNKRSPQPVSQTIRRWLGTNRQSEPAGEQWFERFMRHLPGLAWLKDVSGKYVFVNESMTKALGVTPDALLGKRNVDLMAPELARQCDESDAAAAVTENGVRVVEQYAHVDGTMHSTLVSKFAVSGTEQAPMLIGGIAIDITDRIAAEEQLRRSEERLRLATQKGRVGVWEWDMQTDRIAWTESLYRIHGVSTDQFDGTLESYSQLIYPDDHALVMGALQTALGGEADYEAEFRVRKSDGSIAWLYTNAEVVFEQGKPIRMIGATVDVTSRKQTEFALRESEERFAKAFNASPVVLTLSSLTTGKLVEVNDTFCRVTGYSRDEAIGRSTLELGLWANADDREIQFGMMREIGGVRDREYRFRKRDGSELVGQLSAERIVIRGEPHALSVIQDVTDRAAAVRALKSSEERLRLALRGANAGAWVYHVDANAAFWSPEFRTLFGFLPDVPCSLDILSERVHPDDRDAWRGDFRQILRSAAGEFRQEFRILHPTRGVRWMLTLGRVDRDGTVVNCHGISLDITRLKQVEDELRMEDQRKNEFLATLAHELRNPLAPIRNGLEILRLAPGDGPIAQQAREMMERQLRQMVRLIDDLLDLSRISRGKIELKREPTELKSIVQNALEVSRPLIEQGNHQLTFDIASETLCVDADATRLAQVFANLLNNAAKYTNNGGHIRVTVQRETDDAVVRVRDNGIGLPQDMLPRIFDMFTQVDRSLEKAQGGLGIGLSIAKQLIEMHCGSIAAQSAGIGQGAEFIVRLPLCAPAPSAHAASEHMATRSVKGLRILVADDNIDAATSLAMMLTMGGNEVRTARDGIEAVEAARTFVPQAVLLDIGMPRLNGYDACRRMRAIEELKNCLIVATTGWGQDDDISRSRDAGFDHHLVKPIESHVLGELLARECEAREERKR